MNEWELLREIVETYSPSGREAFVAQKLHSWLSAKEAFDRVLIDEVGNVIAIKGSEPYLLLCSHLDTVPGKLRVEIQRETLWGRGAVDAKGPLVAMAAASAQCAESGVEGIMFAGVVGEEEDSRGVRYLLSQGHRFLGGIFGEPTHIFKIGISYKGRIGVSLTAQGVASHAASPTKNPNVIEKVVKSALSIEGVLNRLGCTTTMTRIRGGVADNVMPPDCTVHLDIRVPTSRSLDEVKAAMLEQSGEDLQIRIDDEIPPVNVGRTNMIFNAATRAIREAGREPIAVSKAGTCDMNLFYASHRVPCLALGPGDSSLSHTSREHIQLEDFSHVIDIYTRIIRIVCEGGPRIASLAA